MRIVPHLCVPPVAAVIRLRVPPENGSLYRMEGAHHKIFLHEFTARKTRRPDRRRLQQARLQRTGHQPHQGWPPPKLRQARQGAMRSLSALCPGGNPEPPRELAFFRASGAAWERHPQGAQCIRPNSKQLDISTCSDLDSSCCRNFQQCLEITAIKIFIGRVRNRIESQSRSAITRR